MAESQYKRQGNWQSDLLGTHSSREPRVGNKNFLWGRNSDLKAGQHIVLHNESDCVYIVILSLGFDGVHSLQN